MLRRYVIIVCAGAVYLFSVGIGMLVALPILRLGDGAIATWGLTAIFAAYAATAFVRHLRSARRPDPAT